MTRNLSFDGLRGCAALSVLALHLRGEGLFPFPGQNHAVDLFFILSGFVIAAAYEARIPQLSLKGFMLIRLRKLYPIWALSLTLLPLFYILLWAAFHYTADLGVILGSIPFQALFLPSPPAWVPADRSAFILNGPGWSLSLEMLINILYAVTITRLNTLALAGVVVASAIALFVLAYLHVDVAGGSDWTTYYVGVVRVFFGFALGLLLYRLPRPTWHTPVPLLCALLVGSFCIPSLLSLIVVMPLCVWLAATSRSSHPVLLWSGRLSYPLYAIHMPALAWSEWAGSRALHLTGAYHAILNVAAALAATLVLYYLDEWFQGVMKRRRQPKSLTPRQSAA